ncbi:hypothetical protein MPH_05942 [Macrophomina phaseolina MS6]|uniref:Uncharacterized protein n=1 Tax=Macrophomina phaseolina (strain MS6) TaxID=1126212 RepID=K2S2U4_MACPH|nr:hypothetical protein MPH_05942 [Macrophomina phaseolina MS6]
MILAAGYDAIIGGLIQIDIRGASGVSVKEKWEKDGASTYLGMSSAGFPNMFFTYGPQAPTALCNGPICAEMQGNWIVELIGYMQEKDLEQIDAETECENEYVQLVHDIARTSLLSGMKSVSGTLLTSCWLVTDFTAVVHGR